MEPLSDQTRAFFADSEWQMVEVNCLQTSETITVGFEGKDTRGFKRTK